MISVGAVVLVSLIAYFLSDLTGYRVVALLLLVAVSVLAMFLDIVPVREIKRRALMEHKSQEPEAIWEIHERMHRRRGAGCDVEFAEAYRLVEAKEDCPLLPVVFLRKRGTEPSAKLSESSPGGRRP